MTAMGPHEQVQHVSIFGKGMLGTVSAFGGAGISLLGMVEAWLRICSLAVGLAVGLITLHSLLKGRK